MFEGDVVQPLELFQRISLKDFQYLDSVKPASSQHNVSVVVLHGTRAPEFTKQYNVRGSWI